MNLTTLDPSVIKGVDMDSTPMCEALEECEAPADYLVALVPCRHLHLACSACLAGTRDQIPRRVGDLRCVRCRTVLAEPFITVVPL